MISLVTDKTQLSKRRDSQKPLYVDIYTKKLKTLQSRRLLQGLIKQREIELSCDISTGQYQSSSAFYWDITNLQKYIWSKIVTGNYIIWRGMMWLLKNNRNCTTCPYIEHGRTDVSVSQMSQWVRSEKIKVSVETIKLSITFTWFVYLLHCCLHMQGLFLTWNLNLGCLLAVFQALPLLLLACPKK